MNHYNNFKSNIVNSLEKNKYQKDVNNLLGRTTTGAHNSSFKSNVLRKSCTQPQTAYMTRRKSQNPTSSPLPVSSLFGMSAPMKSKYKNDVPPEKNDPHLRNILQKTFRMHTKDMMD